MSGRDVIGVAKTGSGKTIAFLLPLFRQIKDQRPLENMEGPMAIVMTPTRELAVQIHRECKPFLKALNLRVSKTLDLTHLCGTIWLMPSLFGLCCRLLRHMEGHPLKTKLQR